MPNTLKEIHQTLSLQLKQLIKRDNISIKCNNCHERYFIPLVNLKINTNKVLTCKCGKILHIPSLEILLEDAKHHKNAPKKE